MYNWDENPDLNITPLIDIMLVLMAIFMITIPVMQYQEQIDLPEGSKDKKVSSKDDSILIEIDKDLKVHYDGKEYPLEDFADSFILKSDGIDKERVVYINADKSILYDNVMYILKVVKQSGFKRASLLTL